MPKSEKIVKTKELRIYQNTFIYDDAVIQLDNISRISISPVAKKRIPLWTIVCIIAGVIVLFSELSVGIALVCIGGGFIVYIAYKNSNAGHYLTLELNSGRLLYFKGKNVKFLNEIMRTMADCMNNKNQGYVINMGQATIKNMQVGNGNTMI